MRIGIVVDSSCDLPSSFFKNHDVELMPTTIVDGERTFVDEKDDLTTIKFHLNTQSKMLQKEDAFAESHPYKAQQIEALFLENLVHKYDHVFCVMATHARSEIYDHVMTASTAIFRKHREVRRNAGVDHSFTMTVINSGNIFTGTGALTAELVRMIKSGAKPAEIETHIKKMAEHTYCYMVPPDLKHIYKRASKRGDKSISWTGFMLGSMLDIKPILRAHRDETGPVAKLRHFEVAVETMFANATRAIKSKLLSPEICIGYGGDPEDVAYLPGFTHLKEAAEQAGARVHVTPMSISGAVHTGPGCVSIGFISNMHWFEETI